MRIVIDMQGAQTDSRFRGIGRYTLALAKSIAYHAGLHEIWLVVSARFPGSIPSIRAEFHELVPSARIRVFDVPAGTKEGSWSKAASEIIREDFIASLAPDVVLLTSVFEGYHSEATTSIGLHDKGVPTAAVLYDLIPLLHPQQYLASLEMREYYLRKIDWMKKAHLLLAISESSRLEGIRHLGRTADDVVNISTSIGPMFQQRAQSSCEKNDLLSRLGISRRVVLYAPGGFDFRKNLARLIEAYSLLSEGLRKQHQMVIVSNLNSTQRTELNDLRLLHGLGIDELVLPGYVSDDELIALYSLADLFVFPSLHEGFGLPALEAMACGAIVIGSNCTSIPEVIGLEEALFDPTSVESIANKLTTALIDEGFRQRFRLHGQQHVKKFSWDASAIQAIQALESMHLRAISQKAGPIESVPLISALGALSCLVKPSDTEIRATARCVAFNRASERPQFLLDISSLVVSDAKSGIQRVVRSLLAEFLKDPPAGVDVQPIYFDGDGYRYAKRFTSTIKGDTFAAEDPIADFWQDDIYLSLDLIMHVMPMVYGLHAELSARGVKLYYIVYDILLAEHPEWWPNGAAAQFNFWLKCISELATGLICISRAVADEVAEWLTTHPPTREENGPKIASFHLGADVSNSLPTRGMAPCSVHVLEQIKSRTSFLMVSTIEPRKGYAQALAAFELLWEKGHDINLIIVGKRGWLVDDLVAQLCAHPERNRRLHWLEGISDEYLELLYQKAQCLIAASEGEGFGLPLIEAAQHELPIVARDIPVFREVTGDSAFYFRGKRPEQLATAIEGWILQFASGLHPTSKAVPWLTWKQSAENLVRQLSLNTFTS